MAEYKHYPDDISDQAGHLRAITERLERQNELMVEFIQAANASRNVCPKCGSRCHCR